MAGLYIHVPFCMQKCRYCDFYSLPTGAALDQGDQVCVYHRQFLNALKIELDMLPDYFYPETIFVGGGTPTEISDDGLSELLGILHKRVSIEDVKEWTCEGNPETIDNTTVKILKASGVNRISLGVQSFNHDVLAFLGRVHSAQTAIDSYQLFRSKGFGNINLDLIYGTPGVRTTLVENDVDRLIELNPEHVSCYCLSFEEGTPLHDALLRGDVVEQDEDICLEQYNVIRSKLKSAGYKHYEISNFAKPGYECQHNLIYWGGGDYIGCGPAAHSHWQGKRYANVSNLQQYCAKLKEGKLPIVFEEALDPESKARETLIMGLRKLKGVQRVPFQMHTGFDFYDLCSKEIEHLKDVQLLEGDEQSLRLTERGLFISDAVFAELV